MVLTLELLGPIMIKLGSAVQVEVILYVDIPSNAMTVMSATPLSMGSVSAITSVYSMLNITHRQEEPSLAQIATVSMGSLKSSLDIASDVPSIVKPVQEQAAVLVPPVLTAP